MRTRHCVLFALLCLVSTSLLARSVHPPHPSPKHHTLHHHAHSAVTRHRVICWHRVIVRHRAVWRYHTVIGKHAKCPSTYHRRIPRPIQASPYHAEAYVIHPYRRWQPAANLHMESSESACLATALYRESRGESEQGNVAVGYVILNRTKDRRFPSTICGVVNQGKGTRYDCQFSWACHPPAGKIDTVYYRRAQHIAELVLQRAVPNPIGHALYFHELSVHALPSRLARYHRRIGHHIFYAQQPIVTELASR